MRTSHLLIKTTKDAPADAAVMSHSLLVRAGFIISVGSGLYNWLPLGWKVVLRLCEIIRLHMSQVDMQEVAMSFVQPSDLWQQTQRWHKYGKELLRFQDRHNADFCLGPTHEEVVTFIAKNYLSSRKQLPFALYQIQTKFRDEIRPRFGIMRAREFLMKDGYSFHETTSDGENYYNRVFDAYNNCFSEIGLDFRAVVADSGQIGGSHSHEFHALADVGEDDIVVSNDPNSRYAANLEKVPCAIPETPQAKPQTLAKVYTPQIHSIKDVSKLLDLPTEQCIKLLIVRAHDYTKDNISLVAIALCGHHQLNLVKAEQHPLVCAPCVFASDDDIAAHELSKGYIGPIDLPIPLIVDNAASKVSNFSCGANEIEYHYINTNWHRDCDKYHLADVRNACQGDPSPCGKGTLVLQRGMEIGHIFQLGDDYSRAMKCSVADADGQPLYPIMGCYGIGVSRIVAALVEQYHDEKGMVWPESVAPFRLAIAALNSDKSQEVRDFCNQLYERFVQQDIDVLLDDRSIRVGHMLSDLELMGIPWVLVVGDKGLAKQTITLQHRASGVQIEIALERCVQTIIQHLAEHAS